MCLLVLAACGPTQLGDDADAELSDDPLGESQAELGRPNFQAPFPCGQSWTYSHHSAEVRRALDFVKNGGGTNGTPVLASAAGTATRFFQAGGAGNYIKIDHGGGWQTYYFHLSSYSVPSGAVVAQGQQIGITGTTGASSGPHIHYEQLLGGVGQNIVINGVALSPYPASYGQRSLVSANCGGGGGGTCGVRADGKLYCTNAGGAAVYSAPNGASAVVNHLRTTFSWFDCWAKGTQHAGGNTTWYHTLGDDNGNWGFVPAVSLLTTSGFDANPSGAGLKQCPGSAPPPPPPPPTSSSCGVRSDGKLYCTNTAGAAIFASPNGGAIVNRLRTTVSWFDCWSTGAQHAGGNTTWYHTLGDDNGNWGWVPAVDLATTSAIDANPTAIGLRKCG